MTTTGVNGGPPRIIPKRWRYNPAPTLWRTFLNIIFWHRANMPPVVRRRYEVKKLAIEIIEKHFEYVPPDAVLAVVDEIKTMYSGVLIPEPEHEEV